MLAPGDCNHSTWNNCRWTIPFLWYWWNWFTRVSVVLLVLMSIDTCVIAFRRSYTYTLARRQSRHFLKETEAALCDGKFDGVSNAAKKYAVSPVASVMIEGIQTFASVPAQTPDREAAYLAERACERARGVLVAGLAKGLATLRSIALLAPFIGLGGTCIAVLGAFREIDMEKTVAMMVIALGIAQSLIPTALGLSVGIIAVWFHNHLSRRVELIGSDMLQAENDLLDLLKTHPKWRHERHGLQAKRSQTLFTTEVPWWEVPYDRQRPLLIQVWGCAAVLAILLLHSC